MYTQTLHIHVHVHLKYCMHAEYSAPLDSTKTFQSIRLYKYQKQINYNFKQHETSIKGSFQKQKLLQAQSEVSGKQAFSTGTGTRHTAHGNERQASIFNRHTAHGNERTQLYDSTFRSASELRTSTRYNNMCMHAVDCSV